MSESFLTGPSFSLHAGSTADSQVSIFYEDENVRLRRVGQMPADLVRILRNSGARTDQLFQCAYLLTDIINGYLALVLGQECFVQRLGPLSSPHTFKIEDCSDVPCLAFLPSGSASPPGLVSCTSSGSMQFWDNIQWATSSSSSPNHYLRSRVDLDEADSVRFLVACGSLGVVIGSRHKLYFVSHHQGTLQHHTLSRHPTWSLLSFLRRHTVPDFVVDPIAACYAGGGEASPRIYALTTTSLLGWDLKVAGPAFVQEWFFLQHLSAIESKLESFKVDFLEMIATSQGGLALVVQASPSREMALVLLAAPEPNSTIELVDVIRLRSTETTIVKVFTVPYHGLGQDAAVVVQFPSHLVFVALGLGRQQLSIPIANDRQLLEVHDVEGTCSTILAGPDAGLLKFLITPPSALGAHLTANNPFYGPYQALRSLFTNALDQMDQELGPHLPTIHVPRDSSVLLNGVVTEIVDEIMGHAQSERASLESILGGRRMRLLNLALLLSENSLVLQVSAEARHYIAACSQKVEGANALYLHHLHRLKERDDTSASQLLVSALHALYLQHDTSDFVTTFFHRDVQRLPDLLMLIGKRAEVPESISRSAFLSHGALMFEANTVLLKTMEACKAYTLRCNPILQLGDPPVTDPWITQVMIQTLATSFLGTVRLLEISPVSHLSPPNTKLDTDWARTVDLQEVTVHARLNARALRIQLGGLGEHLLWLLHYWPHQRDDHQQELTDKIFNTLVHYQMSNEAMMLAERHRDFRSVARLLSRIYSEPAAHHAKADAYAEQYGDDFIYALLSHYAEINRFSLILARGEAWSDQVTNLLSDPKYQSVAWLDDIRRQRFDAAAMKLTSPDTHQNRFLSSKVFMSIGKLALYAHRDVSQAESETLDDQVDVAFIHEDLQQAVMELLKGSGLQPGASDLSPILPSSVTNATPILAKHFETSIRAILGGHMVELGSLVNVLTLKNDWDFACIGAAEMAIEACRCSSDASSEMVNFAVRTVWRRVFLADNWSGINLASRETNVSCSSELRDTLLYATLVYVLNKRFSDQLILKPTECQFEPSQYIASHFPDSDPTHLPILGEYDDENTRLGELISRYHLNEYYAEIYHLALSDLATFID